MEEINFNGIYRCEPNEKYANGSLHWCKNWTFHPKKLRDGRIIMVDTYWNNYYDSLTIEVTDDNISHFELIFDYNEVKKINSSDAEFYDNVYKVANDSGGWGNYKCFVNISENKSFDKVIDNLNFKIEDLERRLKNLKRDKESLLESGQLPSWW